MTSGILAAFAAVLLVGLAAAAWLRARAKRRDLRPRAASPGTTANSQPAIAPPELPEKILIGESPDNPVLVIENAPSIQEYAGGRELDVKGGAVGRLASLLQAVPSVLVAAESHGKRLMEVSINGDLVRASDGNGLRAIAIGKDGIKEHARLFDVDRLQSAINAAAVWQVASVIVAQKHLADINEKLEDIKKAIDGVSQWLKNQRDARLKSIYEYLLQGAQAIQGGELSPSLRHQLESCERDLAEIFDHVAREFEQECKKTIEHTEKIGTEDLARDLNGKIERLSQLATDMQMVIKVRAGCLHLVRLYPGETKLVTARRESIERALRQMQELLSTMGDQLGSEISSMKSWANEFSSWFGSTTLEERKANLRSKRDDLLADAGAGAKRLENGLRRTDDRFVELDRPTRILVEVREGILVAARDLTA